MIHHAFIDKHQFHYLLFKICRNILHLALNKLLLLFAAEKDNYFPVTLCSE